MRDWMWFAGDGDIAAEGRCYNIFIVFSIGMIEGEGWGLGMLAQPQR